MAITTVYRGIEYRSRLEARWAAFFTGARWQFTYEPFDADGYIPDFLIHGDSPLLVEVKPAVVESDYYAAVEKTESGLLKHWTHDILILGADPLPKIPPDGGIGEEYPPAGILGEASIEIDEGFNWKTVNWQWDTGHWIVCGNCKEAAIFHSVMTWSSRPCGCYDGDVFLGPLNTQSIRHAWAVACNETKWRA